VTAAQLRDFVRGRAGDRCEYCLLAQAHSDLVHHIEHVIARQHGGRTVMENLALACRSCNLNKGTNLTGIDPVSGNYEPLFHPRRQQWTEHFRFVGPRIEGITPTGRVTVMVLAINDPDFVDLRATLIGSGLFQSPHA
jgi:hypothetical protein